MNMRRSKSERERKDTVEKEFVSYPDTAADLLNVLLYQGREVVCADSLLPGPTETIYLADYLAEREITQLDRKVKHKAALVRLLSALSGETDLEEIENQLKEPAIREEDDVTMAGIFTQYMEQGKTEGRAEELISCIDSAVKNLHITLEEACEALGTTVSRYEEAKSVL